MINGLEPQPIEFNDTESIPVLYGPYFCIYTGLEKAGYKLDYGFHGMDNGIYVPRFIMVDYVDESSDNVFLSTLFKLVCMGFELEDIEFADTKFF